MNKMLKFILTLFIVTLVATIIFAIGFECGVGYQQAELFDYMVNMGY